jgi:hypothetical protein
VRHHTVLRAGAHAFEVPKAHQVFRRFDASETSVEAQRVDQAFHLQNGRQVAKQEAARFKRIPSAFDYMPRLWKIENDAVDIRFAEVQSYVAEFHCPVRRRPEVPRDIFLR